MADFFSQIPPALRTVSYLRNVILSERQTHLQSVKNWPLFTFRKTDFYSFARTLEGDQLRDFSQVLRILKDAEGGFELFGAGIGINGENLGSAEVMEFMQKHGPNELQ